jgi:glycosyltransferase involved in cell wall biosynthesis
VYDSIFNLSKSFYRLKNGEKRMNILVVSQYFWPENFRINDICLSLRERHHDITVLTGLPNVPEGKFYKGYSWFKKGVREYNGIKIVRVPITPRGKNNFPLLTINCLSFFINALFYIPTLARQNFDCIFMFQVSPISSAIPALLLKKIKKIPAHIYVQDIWPESMYYLLNLKRNDGFIFRFFDRICSYIYKGFSRCYISSRAFREILLKKGVAPHQIVYFPQWSEQDNVMEYDTVLSRDLGLNRDDFVLTFTGNIGRAQGFDMILKVAENIKKKGYENIKWLFVGDGTELDNIKEHIKKSYYLKDIVITTGWKPVEDMPRYYSISNALIVVLKEDFIARITLPSKVQSYMAAGKPIIASLGDEGAYVIRESDSGFVSELGDAQGFEDNILELYRMAPQKRAILGNNALRYSSKMFDREKLIQFLENSLYNFNAEK